MRKAEVDRSIKQQIWCVFEQKASQLHSVGTQTVTDLMEKQQ
jgi:hypothetical protein